MKFLKPWLKFARAFILSAKGLIKKGARMKVNNIRGMTLMEILVASFVVTIALGALLSGITSVVYLIDLSREQTKAVSDLNSMMEMMRSTPFDAMLVTFPNGVIDGPLTKRYPTILGGYGLNNEHIIVTYPNENAEPLEMKVNLTWQDKRQHAQSASMSTFKTR